MTDIFISYSRKNEAAVKQLVRILERMRHTVHFDQDHTGGHVWWDAILADIRASKVFIIALSYDYLDSYPCSLEYAYAQKLNRMILPVMVSPVDYGKLPVSISRVNIVKFDRARDEEQILDLSGAITDLDKQPTPPLPDPLPTPPDAPIPRVSILLEQIVERSVELTSAQQESLTSELLDLYLEPNSRESARFALEKLRERPELRTQYTDRIDRLLALSPRDLRAMQPRKGKDKARRRQTAWMMAVGAVLIIVVIVAILIMRGGGLLPVPTTTQIARASYPTAPSQTPMETPDHGKTIDAAVFATHVQETVNAVASYTKTFTPSPLPTSTFTTTSTPTGPSATPTSTLTSTRNSQQTNAAASATNAQATRNVVASYTKTFTPTPTSTPTLTPTSTLTPTPPATFTASPTLSPTNGPTLIPVGAAVTPTVYARKTIKDVSFVWVPAGCFLMGSDPAKDKNAQPNEQPQHKVCITQSFWIGEFNITNAQFAAYVKATGATYGGSGYCRQESSKTEQPVVCVSWDNAAAYAKWLGGRLPTEAESVDHDLGEES